MTNCLILLNCKKYNYKRQNQINTWLKSFNIMPWFHIIGDTTLESEYIFNDDKNILIVNVPDDYISLPKKTYMAIKAIRERYPDIQYIFKTDDDTQCDENELNKYLQIIPDYDYGGYNINILQNSLSEHHCMYTDIKEPKLVLACTYCSGPFYFLSRKSIDYIISRKNDFWTYVYEDNVVGYVLKSIPSLKILSMPNEIIFKQYIIPEPPIVSVNIMGGLGNQMFQFASAYAYSRKYNGNLKIERNKRSYDRRPLYWDSILNKCIPYLVDSVPNNLVQWRERDATEYTEISPLNQHGIFLNGYLQTEKYFYDNNIRNEIKELFRPSNELLIPILNKYKSLLENKDRVVVIHARRTDYLKNQDIINFHGPLTVNYYKEALPKISKNIIDPIFLLVSDDPSFWLSVIPECEELQNNNIYILNNENEINTMVLLQQFQYFIIANSTFSWWCAYLSKNPKKVIAPSKWFGPTGPKNYSDIYLPEWELV